MAFAGLTQGEQVLSAKRVFGEPVRQDGLTIIPAAKVAGGAGGGSSEARDEQHPAGEGGGFGVAAKPAGVYVIRGEKVQWIPAVDVNRVILGAQLVAASGLIAWGLSRLGRRQRRWWR